MKKPALSLFVVVALTLTACGSDGGWKDASNAVPNLKYADYYALCDTYAGEVGKATSPAFQNLTSSQRQQVFDIVSDDSSCQPDK